MKKKGVVSFAVLMLTGLIAESWAAAPENEVYLPKQPPVQISADGNVVLNGAPVKAVIVDPNPDTSPRKIPPPVMLSTAAQTATASFEITYISAGDADRWGEPCYTFPEEAKAAFNAAANIWANIIDSDVPITIQACWAAFDSSSTLGYAGGQPLYANFTGAPVNDTFYGGSLVNALAGSDLSGNADMHITYNSSFTWYYGTDGNTPAGQYDLLTVVLHEIAHGLNFTGSMQYSDGTGAWGVGNDVLPVIYDRFIRDGAGNSLINTSVYSNSSTALGTALTSEDLWFHGPKAMEANGGQRVKIYAPSTWNPGSSYAHLDYGTYNDTANELMVFAVSSGESVHDPGAVTKGLLQDLGWPINTPTPLYTVTPSAGSGGSISPSSAQTVAHGSTTSFTVSPNSGYSISSVGGTCGGTLSGNTYTTNAITSNCTVVASFSQNANAVVLAAGATHSAAILPNSTLWAWGSNLYAQLGDGTTTDRITPTQIGTDDTWLSLSSASIHTLGIKKDGTLWSWGHNSDGQLGNGTTNSSRSPVQIGTAKNWTHVAAGGSQSAAIKTDGTLWIWGRYSGQLDGASSKVPVQIGTDNTWKTVTAGAAHTLAIKQNGTLWAWGGNYWGQFGNGTTNSSDNPVQIGIDTDWISLKAGSFHTLAIKQNGTLWAWGDNTDGQLGNGTKSYSSNPAPMQIGTATDWKVVAGGNDHSLAIKTNGTLWSWGANEYGQLGDATNTDRHTPVQIGSDTTWQAVAAGWTHSIAAKNDGSLWGWGSGPLGDGTTTDRNTPVQSMFPDTQDSDSDGINDEWELFYFGDLTTAGATSDFDRDGYTDLQEYQNFMNGELDPEGNPFGPTDKNISGGTGYVAPASAILPVIYMLLL